jgi:hypothetical protein
MVKTKLYRYVEAIGHINWAAPVIIKVDWTEHETLTTLVQSWINRKKSNTPRHLMQAILASEIITTWAISACPTTPS